MTTRPRQPGSTRWAAALAAGVLLAGACGSDEGGGRPGAEVEGSAPSSTTRGGTGPTTTAGGDTGGSSGSSAPTSATSAEAPPLADVRVTLTEVAQLDAPTALAPRPGSSSLYVAERAGLVRELRPEGDGFAVVEEPVLDLSDDTTTDGERGLLGLAFSADGDVLYVSHTNAEGDSRLAQYEVSDGAVDPASRVELLAVDQPFANHNGGDVQLGPDGHLWFGLGDGGAADDPEDRAQDPGDLLGKLLRIDPTRPGEGDTPYAIPDGNPFADGGGAPEVFLLGLRNPWRFTFDRATDDLWIADVGQNQTEEIDRIAAPIEAAAGANLGWSAYEGSTRYLEDREVTSGELVGPVFEMSHDDGWCSVTGGVVYRGEALPDLQGAYLFGDFCKEGLNALRLGEDGAVGDTGVLAEDVASLVSIDEDLEGEVYLLSLDGVVLRLDPAG